MSLTKNITANFSEGSQNESHPMPDRRIIFIIKTILLLILRMPISEIRIFINSHSGIMTDLTD